MKNIWIHDKFFDYKKKTHTQQQQNIYKRNNNKPYNIDLLS